MTPKYGEGVVRISGNGLCGNCIDPKGWIKFGSTKPGPLSAMTKASYSKAALFCMMLGASPNPLVVWFHGSLNWGCRDGDPITDDETDAPDSDEAERTGGWFSND